MTTVFGDTAQTYWQRVALMKSLAAAQALLPSAWYEMLEEYYLNNGLYDLVQAALHENAIWTPGMKPLRNPAHRAVEFYVSKLWAGPLPIVTKNARLPDAIAKIDEWSNWGAQKQLAARWLANFGDLFVKIAVKTEDDQVTRVYKDPIKPKHITNFDLDERGFITYIRIDVPTEDQMHTEIWSKTRGGYRLYKHNRTIETPVEQLGTPTDSKTFADLGFDFIPIVHAKFQDIGETRGVGCFVHALDKIDEANRQATRLHQILFRYNKPTNVVSANAMDASGKPLPPPTLTGADGTSSDSGEITKGDDDVWMLPGMSGLEQLVPNINYADALAILNAQMNELSNDLPEILYYELKDKGEMSSLALKILLGPAVDKVIEARGNAEPALVRANQMALTIAGIHKLDGFQDLGSFESGALAHTFAERDVIPMSAKERAETVGAEVTAGMPLLFSMKRNGFTDAEIAEVMKSEEYRLRMAKLLFEVAQVSGASGMPFETLLRSFGWTDEQLTNMGTQKLAAIKLMQEDRIPPVRQ
ncbi:MAG: hypothetical protein A2139_07595 [Desulfobacca sp. RBG_16_60_12]|nr:MAG: hypothetical protein A2139_07595 [Desulfobacca sp. RBG_16_60_12]